MKKLFIIILPIIFVACKNEYILYANLGIASEQTFKRIYKTDKDSIHSKSITRRLSMYYFAENESNDTILIPIGYPLNNPLISNIESHDSLKMSFYFEGCSKRKGSIRNYFAPGDSITLSFDLYIDATNNNEYEWLEKISIKELISKLQINMVKPTKGKDLDKIPNIIFNNDTSNICINPTIGGTKTRKKSTSQ